MRRYSTTRTKRDKSGVSVYRTTLYPEIPIENADQFIYSKIGDRVDSLASKYYGDNTLWWIIAKANGIRGKIALSPATLLRIPSDVETIVQRFIELNQEG
tara:strand:- start:930 stop:1229 length:300 start_codon:yes stop_codon:yes gene_type:complete